MYHVQLSTGEEVDHTPTGPVMSPQEVPTNPPRSSKCEREECPSCLKSYILVSVITAITTALLTTAIFLLILICVCKYTIKKTRSQAATLPLGQMDRVYDQVGEETWSTGTLVTDPSDHTYMEVKHEYPITVRENDAYSTSTPR